jgi:hypothetical protein
VRQDASVHGVLLATISNLVWVWRRKGSGRVANCGDQLIHVEVLVFASPLVGLMLRLCGVSWHRKAKPLPSRRL